jgi:hypothetical protein
MERGCGALLARGVLEQCIYTRDSEERTRGQRSEKRRNGNATRLREHRHTQGQ